MNPCHRMSGYVPMAAAEDVRHNQDFVHDSTSVNNRTVSSMSLLASQVLEWHLAVIICVPDQRIVFGVTKHSGWSMILYFKVV
jgi:hypothetical protein